MLQHVRLFSWGRAAMFGDQVFAVVYVRLLEGGITYVPCVGKRISDLVYEIIDNEELDMEDYTAIWQFFPGDIVGCVDKAPFAMPTDGMVSKMENESILIAENLVDSKIDNRDVYGLIYDIVAQNKNSIYFDCADHLCLNRGEISYSQHPAVRRWISRNCKRGWPR